MKVIIDDKSKTIIFYGIVSIKQLNAFLIKHNIDDSWFITSENEIDLKEIKPRMFDPMDPYKYPVVPYNPFPPVTVLI